jgi:hypothetical protein
MNPLVRAFQRAAIQAASLRQFPISVLIKEHGLDDFLIEADAQKYSVQQMAAQALCQFCLDDDGAFNGFEVGILAVMEFLNEQRGRPASWQQGMRDLVTILQKEGSYGALAKWVTSYYP